MLTAASLMFLCVPSSGVPTLCAQFTQNQLEAAQLFLNEQRAQFAVQQLAQERQYRGFLEQLERERVENANALAAERQAKEAMFEKMGSVLEKVGGLLESCLGGERDGLRGEQQLQVSGSSERGVGVGRSSPLRSPSPEDALAVLQAALGLGEARSFGGRALQEPVNSDGPRTPMTYEELAILRRSSSEFGNLPVTGAMSAVSGAGPITPRTYAGKRDSAWRWRISVFPAPMYAFFFHRYTTVFIGEVRETCPILLREYLLKISPIFETPTFFQTRCR